MAHSFVLFASLAAVWLLLSGHYNPLLLAFGALSCTFVLFLARRLGLVDREGMPLHVLQRLPGYWLWLLGEVVKANIDVARRIVDPKLPVSPRMFEVETRLRTDFLRALYANSITLTPGTIAVDVRDDSILVHALTAEGQAALETGEMDARVAAL